MSSYPPQDILGAVCAFMGKGFVQGLVDELYEELNGTLNTDLIVLASGVITNLKTGVDCTDGELEYFIDWCKTQEL